MHNIENLLQQANKILNQKLEQLKVLEAEKKQIMEQYSKATSAQKSRIEIEMQKSEQKYKILCEEVLELSQKVKDLKQKYC